MNINEEIQSLIDAATEPASANRFSVDEIGQWLSEYLELYKAEVSRFPELNGTPHADLLMADYDLDRPALFVVAAFTDQEVVFAAGRGESWQIRKFLESEATMDSTQIISDLAARFFISEKRIGISRKDLSDWLD